MSSLSDLERNAIKEMVLTRMKKRRQAQKDAALTKTASDTVSADNSSSTNGTPPGLFHKKRERWVLCLFKVLLKSMFSSC